ncbi:YkgJ family cysteine cluster protein [Trichloromonas sp.]|uniref:YkgJ family cysteine cluster protein n=1 Tax=Trichloromonas sp. TaxID=3069249 RepID=UPI003D819400
MGDAFDLRGYEERVQQLAMEHLSDASNADDLVKMMKIITDAAESELADHLEGGEQIACRAGCGSCCILNVAVLFPEVLAIVDFVKTRMSPEQQRTIVRRVDVLFRQVRWLGEEERLFLRQSCAFLDESGDCVIYPVRPLICRAITSIDPRHCEAALDTPNSDEARTVIMNLFQKGLMEGTFVALCHAQAQLGFEDRSGQLTVGVQGLFDAPELADRYLERKNVWGEQAAG